MRHKNDPREISIAQIYGNNFRQNVGTQEPSFLKCVVETTTETEAAEVEVQELNDVRQELTFLKLVVEEAMQTGATETKEAAMRTEVVETQEATV